MKVSDLDSLPEEMDAVELVVTTRYTLGQTYGQWKQETAKRYDEYDGKLDLGTYPDGGAINQNNVQNLVHDDAIDLSNMVAEATPSIVVPVVGRKKTDSDNASLRRAVHRTYWEVDKRDLIREQLALDLLLSGSCFVMMYADPTQAEYDEKFQYPCHHLLKPLGAYPVFSGNRLLQFVYVESKPVVELAALYPDLGLENDQMYGKKGATGEIIDFLTPKSTWRCVHIPDGKGKRGTSYRVSASPNPIGKVPVAWDMLSSGRPGTFEDRLRSLGPMVKNANMVFSLMMEAGIRGVFGGYQYKGVISEGEAGPDAHLELDPTVPNAGVAPIPAPEMPREMPFVLDTLMQGARNAGAYPAQRGGGDLPSIVSAQGIQAVQGERDSVRGSLQRHLSNVFEQMQELSARLDVEVLNFRKPLEVASGDNTTYIPKDVFKGRYRCQVLYPNQGMSPLNREVLNYQALGNRIMSRRTAMEQSSVVPDADIEFERIAGEIGMDILIQRYLAGADIPGTLAYAEAIDAGKSAAEAIKALIAAQQAPVPALGQAAAPTPEGTQPGSAPEQATSLEKGATAEQGGVAAPQIAFTPPPLTQVLTRGPQGA